MSRLVPLFLSVVCLSLAPLSGCSKPADPVKAEAKDVNQIPPAEPKPVTRTPSVFRIDERAPLDIRLLDAFTARAFDRLYDELYGLFFAGEVKVPLPGFAEVERIFMK